MDGLVYIILISIVCVLSLCLFVEHGFTRLMQRYRASRERYVVEVLDHKMGIGTLRVESPRDARLLRGAAYSKNNRYKVTVIHKSAG